MDRTVAPGSKGSRRETVWPSFAANHPALAIGAVALTIRCTILLISWQGDGAWNLEADSGRYLSLADALTQGDGLGFRSSNGEYRPEYMTLPPYPMFLATFKLLGAKSVFPALITQCALSAFIAALVFVVTQRTWGRRVGVFAGLLASLDFQAVAYSSLVLTDLFGMMFVFLTIAAILHHQERKTTTSAFVCGLAIAAAIFVRPANIFLPIVATLGVLCTSVELRWHRMFQHLMLVLSIASMPVILWSARNHASSGSWFYTTTPDLALAQWQLAWLHAQTHGVSYEMGRDAIAEHLGVDDLRTPLCDYPDPLIRKKASSLATQMIATHPWTFLRLYLAGVIRVALQPDENTCLVFGQSTSNTGLARGRVGVGEAMSKRWNELTPVTRFVYFAQLPYMVSIWLMATVGAWKGFRQRRTRAATLVLVIAVMCIMLLSGGYPGPPRYRLPAIPLLLVLASYGVQVAAGWLHQLRGHE